MNRIREMRKDRKLTLADVASSVGVSVPYLFDLEFGKRGAKPETWQRIANFFGVTVAELKGGEECAVTDNRADG